jgi:hypothetical protein
MIERSRKTANRTVRRARVTLSAGKGFAGRGFDAEEFILKLKDQAVTPHIAINARSYASGKIRKTAVDGRTTRHEGYAISQRCRKRIEDSFGWAKTIGAAARLKLRDLAKANGFFNIPDDRLQSRQNTKAIGQCRLTGPQPVPQGPRISNPAGPPCQVHEATKAKTQNQRMIECFSAAC